VEKELQDLKPPVVMTFSGHDATGGSGIQADIEAINSQGCHAATVVTCLTVQDTIDASSLIPVSDDIVIHAARSVLEDMPVAAFKIGLLCSVEVIEAVHSILYDYQNIPVIFDPVLASGSGDELADRDVLDAMTALLLPETDVLTPNVLEAAALVPEADTPAAMAYGLMDRGCDHVLLTGVQNDNHHVVNRLYFNQREIDTFEWPRLAYEFHGSGCTLASTLAALMALGLDPLSASREAQNFTWHSLNNAHRLGMGQLIPNRMFWVDEEDVR
jgi:hydroxymethylpyrimidine/phosphomethylpyrimidine kinase